jgi:enamine deaminase RidA (YjgF/YER057c/UK114 family)
MLAESTIASRTDRGIASRTFARAGGTTSEHHIVVVAPAQLGFAEQLDHVRRAYEDTLSQLGLTPESAVFRRIFLSDAMNQAALVRNNILACEFPDSPVTVSIVQQPPLPGSKVALLAYHLKGDGPLKKRRLSMKHIVLERNGLNHLWSTRLCAESFDTSISSAAQTRTVFGELISTLAGLGANLSENCVRTWIYVKDIDVFYQGMVDARRELFNQHGLTTDTHYIASTGIEGACAHRHDLVLMDAYSIVGLKPGQMSYLNDFDHLCATKDYRVTFERGTRIAYADRAHHFISGTASIDSSGQVVHTGDVLRQLDRALENVEALLRSGSASLEDMMHFIVYLRDPADYPGVNAYLSERFPETPMVVVQGPVCRPEWLIEVEGIGVAPTQAPDLPCY